MPLSDLNADELAVVCDCLRCIAEGKVISHDSEFQTLFGIEPSDVESVLRAWPHVDDADENVNLAINNSMNNLLGLVSKTRLESHLAFSREQVLMV